MSQMAVTREERNTESVRALWVASRRGGTEQALALLEPDAEWRLHIYPERVLTSAEFADTMHKIERDRHVTSAQLTQVEARDHFVVAAGSFRWTADDGGIIDFRGYWVYECSAGRIIRGQSFADWSQALDFFNQLLADSAL